MKSVSWCRIRLLTLILAYAAACALTYGQIVPPDVQVSLECLNPQDGKTVWSFPFDRKFWPYRCEAYTNRIVAFLYTSNADLTPDNTEVVFLSSKTGKRTAPFDTRDFIGISTTSTKGRTLHVKGLLK